MNKVLVTGGAGYIGSHTCKALAAEGFTPVVFDNLSEGHREFVQWGELIEGDVRDTPALQRAIEDVAPQAIIHFAASAYVGVSTNDPQSYYENNVVGTLSLLDAMQMAGCDNLVFSSTCAVYGDVDRLPIDSGFATRPINPYGRTKLMVEKILADCNRAFDLNSVSLRYFNAAGADLAGHIGERHIPETHLIPNVINAALDQSPRLQVFGDDYPTVDGTCERDYVHVADLASAHVLAVQYLARNRGTHHFNLGAGVATSIRQIIAAVELQTKLTVPWDMQPRRAGDPASLYADASETETELGWRAKHSDLSTIIHSAVNWAKKERSLS